MIRGYRTNVLGGGLAELRQAVKYATWYSDDMSAKEILEKLAEAYPAFFDFTTLTASDFSYSVSGSVSGSHGDGYGVNPIRVSVWCTKESGQPSSNWYGYYTSKKIVGNFKKVDIIASLGGNGAYVRVIDGLGRVLYNTSGSVNGTFNLADTDSNEIYIQLMAYAYSGRSEDTGSGSCSVSLLKVHN